MIPLTPFLCHRPNWVATSRAPRLIGWGSVFVDAAKGQGFGRVLDAEGLNIVLQSVVDESLYRLEIVRRRMVSLLGREHPCVAVEIVVIDDERTPF